MKKIKIKYLFRENKKRWYPTVVHKEIMSSVKELPKIVLYKGYPFEFYFYNNSKDVDLEYEVFYKEIHPNFYDNHKVDFIESFSEGEPPKCDCGGSYTSANAHSNWCSSREENWDCE